MNNKLRVIIAEEIKKKEERKGVKDIQNHVQDQDQGLMMRKKEKNGERINQNAPKRKKTIMMNLKKTTHSITITNETHYQI